jgi:hypothetical protein
VTDSPHLDHTYRGPALRTMRGGKALTRSEAESLMGAFHVLSRDETSALLDNGETGEAQGRWIVYALENLERVE